MPDLDEESAIHYHNTCISYLIDVSKDPAKIYNEHALAAATILRLYEQVDSESINFNDMLKWFLSSTLRLSGIVDGTDIAIQPPLTGTDFETYLSVVQGVSNSQSIYLNDTFSVVDSVSNHRTWEFAEEKGGLDHTKLGFAHRPDAHFPTKCAGFTHEVRSDPNDSRAVRIYLKWGI